MAHVIASEKYGVKVSVVRMPEKIGGDVYKLTKPELKALREVNEIGPMPVRGKSRTIAQAKLESKRLVKFRECSAEGSVDESRICVPTDEGAKLYNTLFPET